MTKFRAVSIRTVSITVLLLGFLFGGLSCRTYRDGTAKKTDRQIRQEKATQNPEKKPDVVIIKK